MRFIDETMINKRKVVLRCDFNVPMENGVIVDDTRLKKSLKTINYLLLNDCSVIILSHLKRVKYIDDVFENSLKPVSIRLSQLLNREVKFCSTINYNDILFETKNLKFGEVMLLENTRFYDIYGNLESGNDDGLAEFWASLGDIFVIDAFASMHRFHTSIIGVTNYLPTYYGLLIKEELENLELLTTDIKRPFTVFMGASKIDDKVKYMSGILKSCDYLLLGGGIANTCLNLDNCNAVNGVSSKTKSTLEELKRLLFQYKDKIILPVDFKVVDGEVCDIGENSIFKFCEYFKNSKSVFMNGTPGKFEIDDYAFGTKCLFQTLREMEAIKIAGGGATLYAVDKFGYKDAFTYLSSGGGASLEFVSFGTDYVQSRVFKK